MNTEIIELSKIIYCQLSKKYQIFFKTLNCKSYFVFSLSNKYAKNIAMASENIASISLSQYELFISLLNELNITIDKVLIKKNDNVLSSDIYLCNNKKTFKICSHITDSIILSIKTFSNIYIDKKLLLNKNDAPPFDLIGNKVDSIFIDSSLPGKTIGDDSSIEILKNTLKRCVQDEKFESAAFLRDRINYLKNK